MQIVAPCVYDCFFVIQAWVKLPLAVSFTLMTLLAVGTRRFLHEQAERLPDLCKIRYPVGDLNVLVVPVLGEIYTFLFTHIQEAFYVFFFELVEADGFVERLLEHSENELMVLEQQIQQSQRCNPLFMVFLLTKLLGYQFVYEFSELVHEG